MRVTSALWVSAFVRRCYIEGAVAMVARRGAEEAGAIIVIVDWLDGTSDLYAPAPQTELAESDTGGRLFQHVLRRAPAEEITARLDRETRFDPDVWIVAVEDRGGRSFLDLVNA